MINCSLCNGSRVTTRHSRVRDNDDLTVLECMDCGLVFLSSFDHISDQFYEESGMLNGHVDLSRYRQNSMKDDQRRAHELRDRLMGKKLLDFGCGGGGFLHLIKNHAIEAHGVELDRNISEAINEEGIRCYTNIDDINETYDIITMFHVLEHLTEPVVVLQKLKQYLNRDGVIIIEVPNADDALLTLYKSDDFANFTYWSCHVYLYNSHTLKERLIQAGYKVNYVKQVQRYPLSNHLYWLSQGKPGGHSHLGFLDNPILTKEYESSLASVGKCDTLIIECTL